MAGGETGIRPHSSVGEFFSRYCLLCLMELLVSLQAEWCQFAFHPVSRFLQVACAFSCMSSLQEKTKSTVNDTAPHLR